MIYVEELIGPETVNTMPLGDDQRVPGSRRGARRHRHGGRRGGARSCSTTSRRLGVDYDDVTETLELEGVQKFADAFAELLDGVRSKRGELAAA